MANQYFLFSGFYFILKLITDKYSQNTNNTLFIQKEYNNETIDISLYDTEPIPNDFIRLDASIENYNKFCGEERKLFNKEYSLKPITILGCSYAYGHGLKKEESFPCLLSQYTKRPVINYSFCGADAFSSLQNMYTDYKTNSEIKKLITDSEYVIYVYMYDHINRYLSYFYMNSSFSLVYNNPIIKFLGKFSVFRYIFFGINSTIAGYEYPNIGKSDIYLKTILLKLNSYLKQFAPNSKLIIIIYDEKMPTEDGKAAIKFNSDIINSSIWSEFEKETNNIVICSKDITGFVFDKNYKLDKDIAAWHPNKKAWEIFTPRFIRKLQQLNTD